MSNRAPLALSPALLVIRILLFLAFLPNGIQDLGMVEFSGAQAGKVRRLLNPVPDQPQSAEPQVQTAGMHQSTAEPSAEENMEEPPIKERALFKKAILIEATGLGSPLLFAWLVVLVQIVGGSLLLLGLLSRVWALGLCVITAGNFVMLTMPTICATPMMFFSPSGDQVIQILGASQLGLFGCSLLILFCGPGAFSMDRLLFGGPRALRKANQEHDESVDEEFE